MQLGLSTSPGDQAARPAWWHDAFATEAMLGIQVGPARKVNITVRPANEANSKMLTVASSSREHIRLQRTSQMNGFAAAFVAASVVLAIFLCIWADWQFHKVLDKAKEHDKVLDKAKVYKDARIQMGGQPCDVAKVAEAADTMLQILTEEGPKLVVMLPLADAIARTCGDTLNVVKAECSKARDVIEIGLRCVDVVELLQTIPLSLDKRTGKKMREVEEEMKKLEKGLRELYRIVCVFQEAEGFIISLGKMMLKKDPDLAKIEEIGSVLRRIQTSLEAPWKAVEQRRLVLVEKMKEKIDAMEPSSEEEVYKIMAREKDIKDVISYIHFKDDISYSGVSDAAQKAELEAGLGRLVWYSSQGEKSLKDKTFAEDTLEQTLKSMERSKHNEMSALRHRLRGGIDDPDAQGTLARMEQERAALSDAAERARRHQQPGVQGALRTLKEEAPSLEKAAHALGKLLAVLEQSPSISYLEMSIKEAKAAGVEELAPARAAAELLLETRKAEECLVGRGCADPCDVNAVQDAIRGLRENIGKVERRFPTVKSQGIEDFLKEVNEMEQAWLVEVQKFLEDRDDVMHVVKDNPLVPDWLQ